MRNQKNHQKSSLKKNTGGGLNNLTVTPLEVLPDEAVLARINQLLSCCYQYVYTTGPFTLPLNTHSIDWGVLNNDNCPQEIRVTVFKCVTGTVKAAEPPGPIVITLQPGQASHNANSAVGAFFYEIQIECNSQKVFPYASAWDQAIANPIPGSVIPSGCFLRQMP